MTQKKNSVVLSEQDFKVLSDLFNLGSNTKAVEENSLAYEVSRAKVVKNDKLPEGTVRIGSKVKVLDVKANKAMDIEIVLPKDANVATRKISILTPMAAAIIGFKVGDEVEWKMPAGLKALKIVEVTNN